MKIDIFNFINESVFLYSLIFAVLHQELMGLYESEFQASMILKPLHIVESVKMLMHQKSYQNS